MLRFFLSRRWIGLFLVTCLVGFACVELGFWQFSRYHERHVYNAQTTRNLKAPPVPAAALMSTQKPLPPQDEWRTVTATGRYDLGHQFVVLYSTRNGAPGVDVVVPLVTSRGTGLLVDRGWLPTSNNGNIKPHVPPPPSGKVTVTGFVRVNSPSGSETIPYDGEIRAISSVDLSRDLPYPVFNGFVQATHESPRAATPLKPTVAPSLWGGPSFFYGIQWWFFAVLGFGFLVYFGWSEYTGRRPRPTRQQDPQQAEPSLPSR